MAPVNGVNAKLCPSPRLSGMGRQLRVQKKKKRKKLLSQHPGQQSHPEPSLFQTPLVLTLPSAGTLSPILLVKEDCCLVVKLCPTLFNLMDYSPSDSSVHGISQARILE